MHHMIQIIALDPFQVIQTTNVAFRPETEGETQLMLQMRQHI